MGKGGGGRGRAGEGGGSQGKPTPGARFVAPRDAKMHRSRRSGRETSGYARLPGHPAEHFHRAVSRGQWLLLAGAEASAIQQVLDEDCNKLLNHRGSTLAFFTVFPCASLRYVTDCLIWGPRLLCMPLLVQRALLSAEHVGWSGSTGR